MPAFLLKKMIMNNFTSTEVDVDIADSIDFMVERVGYKPQMRMSPTYSSHSNFNLEVSLTEVIHGFCCDLIINYCSEFYFSTA